MFDHIALEQTPVVAQEYVQKASDRPRTANPLVERRASVKHTTSPQSFIASGPTRTDMRTATIADLSDRRQAINYISPKVLVSEDVIEKTSDDRVALLARKYAGKIDAEGAARLQILTERLNQLVPAINPQMVDRLSDVVAVSQRSNSSIEALKARYKI